MDSFKKFIETPKNFSDAKFFAREKIDIDKLQKIQRTVIDERNPDIKFNKKNKKDFYEKLPYFVDVETIIEFPKTTYVVPGGIRAAGARYPDFFINKYDIDFMTYILDKSGILDIEIKNWKRASTEIVKLIQHRLNTNDFNNTKDSRWIIFDYESDSFRDLCMNISSFSTYKDKLIPTNISMLLFLYGDCREHNILLLYFMRIYLHHTDTDDRFFVTPTYVTGGINSANIYTKFKDLKYDHTFPILIDKKNSSIYSLDALHDKTKIVTHPSRQIHNTELKIHAKCYESGFYYTKPYTNKAFLFQLVGWFSGQKMEHMNLNNNNHVYVYGIKFKKIDFDLFFDEKFHDKVRSDLLNSKLCRK